MLCKNLKGTFVRECQSSNVYCQIPHVDSLDYLKADQTVKAVKPSAKPVSLKSVGQFENIHTIFSVIADLAKSHPQKIVHINDVCRECANKGISCDSTKELVSKLKKRGDLLYVSAKIVRIVI